MRKVLVAICVLVLVAGTLLAVGCGGGGEGGPKDVAKKFMDSLNNKDYDAFLESMKKDDRELFEENSVEAKEYFKTLTTQPVEFKIGKEEIKGDEATLDVSKTEDGETQSDKFYLVKENGDWKVDFMKTSPAL